MASATTPHESSASYDRPVTGSARFPDLVWAHWEWQSHARPYSFPRRPRWARPFFALADRANTGPPAHANGGTSNDEVKARKAAYEQEARDFQAAEGARIIRAYWCATEASAVVLTERRKQKLSWLPWRRVGDLELHRVTEWVTADAPRIAELLHGGDMLAVRINRVLHAVPRRIAMEWIFSEQSYLLGFVERWGGHPPRKATDEAVRRHGVEIDRLERYYDRAARKAARIWYFGGMLVGLAAVIGLGALIPLIVRPFGDIDLATDAARTFYVCFVAGALGAMVSVMTRMRQEDGVRLDYEVGELLIVLLGAFRPVLGVVFGVLTYFAIDSKLLPLTPPPTGRQFFYYGVFAFAAGFSERFAHVILGSADLTVAKALAGEEAAQPARPRATPPPPAVAKSNGRVDHANRAAADTAPARTDGATADG